MGLAMLNGLGQAAQAVADQPVAAEGGFWPVLASLLLAAVVLLTFSLCFCIVALLAGWAVLRLTGRRWPLFFILPALNAVLFLVARPYLVPDPEALVYLIVGLPLAVVCSLVAGVLLVAFHSLWFEMRFGEEGSEGKGVDAFVADTPFPDSRLYAFRRGLGAPVDGFSYLCRNRELWRYTLLPVLMNLAITGAAALFLLVAVAAFVAYVHPLFPAGWGWTLLEALCAAGYLVVVLALTFILWLFLKGLFCGYYHEKLAREVEVRLGVRPEELRELSWKYQFVDACGQVGSLVFINGGLLVLHLVPVVGSVAAVGGGTYFNCLFLGAEHFEYPLALRGMRRRERKEFVRKNRFCALGLGASVFFVNFVPVLGALLLATAVVGAVLLHRRLAVAAPGENAVEDIDAARVLNDRKAHG